MSDGKVCAKCDERKSLEDFHRDRAKFDGLAKYCKPCKDGRRKTAVAEKQRKKREARQAKKRVYWRDYCADYRQRAIEVYGGACAECGTTESLEFDHIMCDGAEHRKAEPETAMFRRIVQTGEEISDYILQLLCTDCHKEKTRADRLTSRWSTSQ